MQSIILLHGAIGAADQLVPLANELSKSFTVHTIPFAGHGGSPMPEGEFSIEVFAEQVLMYMQEKKLERSAFFGYSMGGYVAMYLALQHPSRVEKLVTLATKFHWDETIAAKEAGMLDPQKIAEKLPAFARQLQERHGSEHWETLLKKTAGLLQTLGRQSLLKPEELAAINIPVLIMLGDRDQMVSLDETVAVFKSIPGARLALLPGTPHPLEKVKPDRLAYEIKEFLS